MGIVNNCIILFWCVCISSTQQVQPQISFTGTVLDDLLENYSPSIAPGFLDRTRTEVEVNLYIISFDSVDSSSMEYKMSIYFRQSWFDSRLVFPNESLNSQPYLILPHNLVNRVWTPDTCILNEKSGYFHTVTKENQGVRIFSSGRIMYSLRLSATLTCHMNLEQFPMDRQVCGAQFESYAYPLKDILLRWSKHNPVQRSKDLRLPQFELIHINTSEHVETYVTGEYSMLNLKFYLRRELGFYITQTYIPSILIVMLSWVSFFIAVEATPARVSLGILTVLSLTTLFAGVRSTLPRVSYIKAIDVWISVCLAFVFLALLEYAIANIVYRRAMSANKLTNRNKANTNVSIGNSTNFRSDCVSYNNAVSAICLTQLKLKGDNTDLSHAGTPAGCVSNSQVTCNQSIKKIAHLIDRISAVMFPVSFVAFNVYYWAYYTRHLHGFEGSDHSLHEDKF